MTASRYTLSALAAVALLIGGCSNAQESTRDEDGNITEANEKASVFEMQVGDCYNEPGEISTEETSEVGTLPAVPCGEEHAFEVYASVTMDDSEFPGDAAVDQQAGEACFDEFEAFVGAPLQESTLDFTYLYPTSETWEQDDREITCLVTDPEGPTTGSLEGAAR